jgi:flagellar protein FliL
MIKKILLFGGIGLVLVAASGAVTLLFLAPKPKVVTTTRVVNTSSFQQGPTYTFPDRIVNLADPGASRYLKVSIVLEFSPELDSQSAVNKTITQRMTVLEDTLTTLLSSQTTTALSTTAGKDALKQTIIQQCGKVLDTLHVQNVYFTDFVMQ